MNSPSFKKPKGSLLWSLNHTPHQKKSIHKSFSVRFSYYPTIYSCQPNCLSPLHVLQLKSLHISYTQEHTKGLFEHRSQTVAPPTLPTRSVASIYCHIPPLNTIHLQDSSHILLCLFITGLSIILVMIPKKYLHPLELYMSGWVL
jgi:hypothetical protein